MKVGCAIALLLLGFLAPRAAAQNAAPVILGDQTLFAISWGYGAATPQARAAVISDRLRKVAANPLVPGTVTVKKAELSVDLFAGDSLLVSVFDGDARAAGLPSEALARQWAGAIENGIARYRAQHSVRNILIRWAAAIATIVGFVFLFVAAHKLLRRVQALVALRVAGKLGRTEHRLIRLLPNDAITGIVERLFGLARVILTIVLLYAGLQLLLLIFPRTRAQAFQILDNLMKSVASFGATVWQDIPAILFIALIAYVTYYLLKLVRYVFQKIGEGEFTIEGFRPAWSGTTSRLVSIFVVLLAVLIAYPYIPGSDSPAFKGLSIFVGVLVSLGSSGLVGNMLSGIMLTYMDAFEKGDYVTIGNVTGHIAGTSVLTTRVQTRTNRIVSVPNAVVLSGQVTNYTKLASTGVVVTSAVGVGYDAPWRQVEAMLKLAASRTSGIRTSPEPYVLEKSLNQFDITYELNAYLEIGHLIPFVRAELNRNILDAFNEYGVQIMTPAYEMDPDRIVTVPKDRWHAAPAAEREKSATGALLDGL